MKQLANQERIKREAEKAKKEKAQQQWLVKEKKQQEVAEKKRPVCALHSKGGVFFFAGIAKFVFMLRLQRRR